MQTVVERVINLLIYLLESPHPVTADQVRQTVAGYSQDSDEAFHRMFERDKDVLRRLGVPLEMKALDAWEIDFGYTVDPDKYAIPDPGLTSEEKAALSLASRLVRLGGRTAGIHGLLKLGGMERGMGIEPIGADLGSEAEVLGELFRAVIERRPIEFGYRGKEREAEPYGLAHRRGHWYLAAGTQSGNRVYRVDRIEMLNVDDEAAPFRRPAKFSIRELMRTQPWEAGEDDVVQARVRFDASVGWWAARTLGLRANREGAFEVDIPVSNRDAFVGWVLSFGDAAEVLSPDDLRVEIRNRVTQALEGIK